MFFLFSQTDAKIWSIVKVSEGFSPSDLHQLKSGLKVGVGVLLCWGDVTAW